MVDIQTLRRPRLFGLALFDWTLSLVMGFLIGREFLNISTRRQMINWLLLWTLFGILVHKLLGVNTMLGYYLGLNPKPDV